MDLKIHVAYGFHVNCYHSYRGDTNDNLGFGSDIRIIRKILDTLTEFNEQGIPVKGTWDSENFFSLEKILPEYAPDIIEKMKERVIKYGDENIIMGYSNGALGAMNEDEFMASIELAVTNEQGSGLKDLFGECAMLVRPQEVMFTPSQVSLYNKAGVEALCLYYSCVPFDAFRTLVPKLPDELAFNPLTYTYKGESMTVIPTYNNSDICDMGCLRAWVKELRKKQESGEIKHDLLIFVNMDADAIFWESLDLPVIGSKLANTDGIHGLVKEIADLPYIVFDTPGNYIKTHKPLGEIDFTHDTADGNFTGYSSWSEKPYNRKIWTAVERARAMSKVNAKEDKNSPSFKDRVLLLSTTHFGLATPVLNIQREKKADALAESIIKSESEALKNPKKFTVHNITDSTLQCFQAKINGELEDASQIILKSPDLLSYTVIPTDENCTGVYVISKFKKVKPSYTLTVEKGEKIPPAPLTKGEIDGGKLSIKFLRNGEPYRAVFDGKRIGGKDFLCSYITYGGRKYDFKHTSMNSLPLGGNGKAIRIKGEIHLPNELKAGSFTYDFISTPFSQGIYVRTEVNYPYTAETTSISTENSALGRFSDMKWSETVPFQLTPFFSGDTSVIKRNFMDDISSFRTQSFKECDEKNTKLDSFNHQLTAGLVGITDSEYTFAVANARQVLCSMAHCPMRLDEDKTVHMNPFGTYFGKQRHHWSRAKGQILDTFTLITPQGKSLAPSYNGCSETALLGLFAFKGDLPKDEILPFCDGAVVSANEKSLLQPYYDDNVRFEKAQEDNVDEKKLKSPIMTGIGGNIRNYLVKGSRAIFHIVKQQIKAK